VRDAYAIYVVGDSMAPRFRAGTLLFVNPFKPPRRDNGVVVQLDDRAVLIKDFVGWAEDRLDLVQYNPAGPVEVPRARVLAVHTVVGTQES
jgi:phage repressor protein C with HTH and peptisase S24 domain